MASQNSQAGAVNYTFSAFPGVAMLMAGTAVFFEDRPNFKLWLAAAIVPGVILSAFLLRPFFGVDTRRQAKEWIEANVPVGTKMLLDQPHASPALIMDRAETARFFEKTEKSGHPRRIYFKIMLDSHPGGGYDVARIYRTPVEMITLRHHVQWSSEAYDYLDVEGGLGALTAAGVRYVVVSSAGTTRENTPRLAKFFDDLETKCALVWKSETNRPTLAPSIRIYAVPK
jgi:hypothetical protein